MTVPLGRQHPSQLRGEQRTQGGRWPCRRRLVGEESITEEPRLGEVFHGEMKWQGWGRLTEIRALHRRSPTHPALCLALMSPPSSIFWSWRWRCSLRPVGGSKSLARQCPGASDLCSSLSNTISSDEIVPCLCIFKKINKVSSLTNCISVLIFLFYILTHFF